MFEGVQITLKKQLELINIIATSLVLVNIRATKF